MKKLLTIALAAALCAPAFAQKMGMTNSNAPTVKQAVESEGAKISLNYTSITWADGKTMNMLTDKEKGARSRQRLNDNAAKSPLGSFSTSVSVKCGDLVLAAGEYSVYFTITEDCQWQINFADKDGKAQTMVLPVQKSEHESKRLLLCLYAEEEGAGVYVSFGLMSGMLTFVPHSGEGK